MTKHHGHMPLFYVLSLHAPPPFTPAGPSLAVAARWGSSQAREYVSRFAGVANWLSMHYYIGPAWSLAYTPASLGDPATITTIANTLAPFKVCGPVSCGCALVMSVGLSHECGPESCVWA